MELSRNKSRTELGIAIDLGVWTLFSVLITDHLWMAFFVF